MSPYRNYLEVLAAKHMPTKRVHDYLKHYDDLLGPTRHQVRKILEVGVQGGGSLKMWEEYFPHAAIHGIDIDPSFKIHSGGRRSVSILDSTDERQVSSFIAEAGGDFNLIVDDGSHHPADQIKTFKNLFPYVTRGGHYAVEDVGGTRGPRRMEALNAFLELGQGINYWPPRFSAGQWDQFTEFGVDNYWINNVVGLRVFRFLVIVEKGNNPGENPHLAPVWGMTGGSRSAPRPRLRLNRLRELRLLPSPRQFISTKDAKPESLLRLTARWLRNRW